MLELKGIYRTRQAIRSAYLAATVWLLASALVALIPEKGTTAEGQGISVVTETLRGMFDRVVGAAAVPGFLLVVMAIIVAVIHGQDVRRRDARVRG